MRPLSLYESGRSSGEISLRRLLDGAEQRAPQSDMSIAAVAELVCAGGWPGHVGRALPGILRVNRGYLDEIRRTDVSRASGKTRDPVKVGRLLRSLARNVATPVALSKLAAEVGEDGHALKTDTVAEYLDTLDRLMVVENQPAWSPHLRSRATLRQTPVRHFVDPSLAVAALRATPASLAADLEFLGLLFESLVVRDLRVHAQAVDAQVFHYREKDGLEVDAVVEAADGRWAAFEIKLGERWVRRRREEPAPARPAPGGERPRQAVRPRRDRSDRVRLRATRRSGGHPDRRAGTLIRPSDPDSRSARCLPHARIPRIGCPSTSVNR